MSERFMKDFNGDKVFSLEYDKETLKDMVLEKQEENEKLHSIIKEAIEYIRKQTHDEDTGNYLGYPDLINDEHLLNILQGSDKE